MAMESDIRSNKLDLAVQSKAMNPALVPDSNSPFTISLPAVSSNIICVHNQEVSANSVHQRFEVLSAPELPNDNQDADTSESYSNPSAIMPAEMIGEDIWSVILTHAPDGQLAFALTHLPHDSRCGKMARPKDSQFHSTRDHLKSPIEVGAKSGLPARLGVSGGRCSW